MTAGDWVALIIGIAALMVALWAKKDPPHRGVLITLCAVLAVAAISIAVLSSLGFRLQPPTPSPSPGPTTPSPGPTTPSPGPTTTPPRQEAPKAHAEVQLSTNPPMHATLYFGQLEPVIEAMSGRIKPGLSRDIIEGNKNLCVGTVVFSGLNGASGVVYAAGLGSGWTSVEDAPTERVSGDAAVRQQFVVPPAKAVEGKVWKARAALALHQNGAITARSSDYTLKLTDIRSSQLTWLVNDSDVVSCRAS